MGRLTICKMAPKSLFQIEIVEVVVLPVREIGKRKHPESHWRKLPEPADPSRTPGCSSYHSKVVFFPTMFRFSLDLQILKPIKQPYICFFFWYTSCRKKQPLSMEMSLFFQTTRAVP